MIKRLLLVLPCLIASLLLVACGGGDGPSEEAQVEQSLERAAANTEPSECRSTATAAYLEQRTGLTGNDAVEQCEKEASDSPEAEVEVSNVDVEGAKATAEVTFEGSDFDGQTVEVALAKEDGRWKTDRFLRFVDFDRAGVLKAIERSLDKEDGLLPSFVSCFIGRFEQMPDAKLEKSVLSSKRAEELSIEVATACAQPPS